MTTTNEHISNRRPRLYRQPYCRGTYKNNHTVIITDNLINSKIEVLDKLYTITGIKPSFYQIDVTDEAKVEEIFNKHKIDGVFTSLALRQ